MTEKSKIYLINNRNTLGFKRENLKYFFLICKINFNLLKLFCPFARTGNPMYQIHHHFRLFIDEHIMPTYNIYKKNKFFILRSIYYFYLPELSEKIINDLK